MTNPLDTGPDNPTMHVGVDFGFEAARARRPLNQPSLLKDEASRSPTGETWPFSPPIRRCMRFETGVTTFEILASYRAKTNDIRLSFYAVSVRDLFVLRDMLTTHSRIRFTLRDDNGTEARYEVTPSDLTTSANPRLRDATDIEARVVDVKRVQTIDEYWSGPEAQTDPVKDIRAANMRVYARTKDGMVSGDMAAVKDALEKFAAPGAIVCMPLSMEASIHFGSPMDRSCSLMADGTFACEGCSTRDPCGHVLGCKVPEWAQRSARIAAASYRAGGFEAARSAGMAAIRQLAPATSAYHAGAISKSEHEKLEDFLAAEMSQAILGNVGRHAASSVHDAFVWPTNVVEAPPYFKAWDFDGSAARRLADAVSLAITNAPPAVDVGRWTRVVHVLAADTAEDKSTPQRIPMTLAAVTEAIVAYATLRFVHGYDTKEAARRASEKGGGFNQKKLDRFFAAYEAG